MAVIWRLLDGKPGHQAQSRGLAQALGRLLPVQVHDIPAPEPLASLTALASGRFPGADGLPAADLLIGAGHATHLPLLAARRARGGRAVVLMRPSLPLGWFDLCVIPRHDRPPRRPNVLETLGVLNTVRPGQPEAGEGLILVGGESRHFHWDEAALLEQIRSILLREPGIRWQGTDSRRTPAGTRAALAAGDLPGLVFLPWEQTPAGWVAERLARTARVWVSTDSMSMIFEALSAAAAVGVLELPPAGDSRVVRELRRLEAEGRITPHGKWRAGCELRAPAPLQEADRCAAWIRERWLREDGQ